MPSSITSADRSTSQGKRIIPTAVAIGLCIVVAMQVRSCLSTRQRSPVQGRVRVDDRPVTFGVVTVVTADGSTLTAQIRPDGTYTLPHVPPGPVRIAVSSPEPKTVFQKAAEPSAATSPGGKPSRPSAATRGPDGTGEGGPPRGPEGSAAIAMKTKADPPSSQSPARPEHAGWFRIPGRYANPLRSGLGGSVAAEGSTIDLDLSAAADGK